MAEKPGAIAKMVAWQKEHISDRQMTLILACLRCRIFPA